jgi:hypothetical protein
VGIGDGKEPPDEFTAIAIRYGDNRMAIHSDSRIAIYGDDNDE